MTAQIPELLKLDGQEVLMTFCPPLPEGHPRLVERPDAPVDEDSSIWTTACWRRYQASWAIIEERFYLTHVDGTWELLGDGPLWAEWFSGVLRVPRGEQLEYVHMGFGSVYEEEVHIEVDRGRVVARRVLDNRGKARDRGALAFRSLPGWENRFEGDGKGPWTRLPAAIVRFLSRLLRGPGGDS